MEDGVEDRRKSEASYRGDLLGEQVHAGSRKQDGQDRHQADRDVNVVVTEINGEHPLAFLVAPAEAENDQRGRVEAHAGQHAESVSLAQQEDVAAGDQYYHHLYDGDDVHYPVRGPVFLVQVAEPVVQDAVLGHAVEHAVGAHEGGVDRPHQHQHAGKDHQHLHAEPAPVGALQLQRQAAEQVFRVLAGDKIRRDYQRGDKGKQAGEQHAEDEYGNYRFLEVPDLRVLYLAVYLGQCLQAGEGQDGMAESHDNAYDPDCLKPGEMHRPAQRLLGENRGERREREAPVVERVAGPAQQQHGHHRHETDYLQVIVGGLFHAANVLAPEICGHDKREDHGEGPAGNVPVYMQQRHDIFQQAAEVKTGGDGTDGAGKGVVEHQRGNGELGHHLAHGLSHHHINAAAHEQDAGLGIDAQHQAGEEHDAQDEPGKGRAESFHGYAAGVIGAGAEVAEDHGGGLPERDEAEHGRAQDENLLEPLVGHHN